jgi:Holliday junction resolvasome RuvABC endonuclease subunit
MDNPSSWLGIDPGINGVIAHLGEPGLLLDLFKMPVVHAPAAARAGGEVRRVDGQALRDLFARLRPAYAVLEQVQGMSGDTPMTAFSFGYSYGVLEDALRSCKVPVIYAPPSVWKADMGLTADKSLSIPRAQRLFPTSHVRDAGKTSNGRSGNDRNRKVSILTSVDKAEAALIGLWGKLSGRVPAQI